MRTLKAISIVLREGLEVFHQVDPGGQHAGVFPANATPGYAAGGFLLPGYASEVRFQSEPSSGHRQTPGYRLHMPLNPKATAQTLRSQLLVPQNPRDFRVRTPT